MKKLLLTTLILAAGIAQANFWDNCTAYGGTIITANSYSNDKGGYCNDPNDSTKTNNCNGKRFCVGGNVMNWWSAFTWCEAIGGKLARFESVCPGVQALHQDVSGACPNFTKVAKLSGLASGGIGWTDLGISNTNALTVFLQWGNIKSMSRADKTYHVPFCEE